MISDITNLVVIVKECHRGNKIIGAISGVKYAGMLIKLRNRFYQVQCGRFQYQAIEAKNRLNS
ncbi:hypothetical protein A7K99_10215 [Tatumella citrea]|uniref:Uncharacterized protein n=1 Tax=Tatumella citrea TaxID=53336 RepID=A0A1Y0LJ79_TATCI|nr:hypothetical protein A7K98_10215 [Tatumella citrea]ARU98154.1 hypothetical protein A7K99_10215 [Tatumella citrea]